MTSTIYLYNENGLIPKENLPDFCLKIKEKVSFNFNIISKEQSVPASTVFKVFSISDLDFIVYIHGYVMEIEGEIRKMIRLLKELDGCFEKGVVFYVSPIQALENKESQLYPRGSNEQVVAEFLDRLFCNDFYTAALKS